MVSEQLERRGLRNHRVLEAMRGVPRHLFVRADSHGRGLARALWEHAKSRSDSTTFVVNSSLPAVAVYQRFGFVVKDGPQAASGLTFVPMEYSQSADDSFR